MHSVLGAAGGTVLEIKGTELQCDNCEENENKINAKAHQAIKPPYTPHFKNLMCVSLSILPARYGPCLLLWSLVVYPPATPDSFLVLEPTSSFLPQCLCCLSLLP